MKADEITEGGIVGTDPTKRLFFRWLAVEKGEKWRWGVEGV